MCKHFQLTCVEIRLCCKLQQFCYSCNSTLTSSFFPYRPISTQEKFPRTENFLKISLLKVENFLKISLLKVENFLKISLTKVENFQLQNFFPTENLCWPITFYKIFVLRKIFQYFSCCFRNQGEVDFMPICQRLLPENWTK